MFTMADRVLDQIIKDLFIRGSQRPRVPTGDFKGNPCRVHLPIPLATISPLPCQTGSFPPITCNIA